MRTFLNIQLLLDATIIMFFCLLPVFLLTKSIKKTLLVGLSLALFLYVYRDFFIGKTSSYHDTFWTEETLFRIVKQWVNNRYYPGWDPYLNGGEPIYLFSNNFILAPMVLFSFLGELIRLPSHTLFNHCFTFIFLHFCIGSLLLFLALFDDFKIAFFCFLSLLFSGCFDINLGQPSGIIVLYFLPYIIFGLVTSLRNRNPYGIAMVLIYLGLSANQYIPMYVFLGTFLFTTMLFIFYPSYIKVIYSIIKKHYKIIILAGFLALLAAGPAIFLNSQLKDYICPTRRVLAPGGEVSFDNTGLQDRVKAPLFGYEIMLDRSITNHSGIHHAFYFGIISLILIPLALFISRKKIAWVFFITAILVALIGTGNRLTLLFLYKFIPGFNMLRHTFPFAQYVSFFLICVSGYGLKAVFSQKRWDSFKIMIFSILSAEVLILCSKSKLTIMLIFACVIAIILTFFLLKISKTRIRITQLVYLPLFFVLVLDFGIFNRDFLAYTFMFNNYTYLLPPATIADPEPVIYPSERKFNFPLFNSIFSPPDFYSLYFKQATVTSWSEQLVFFRKKRLNDMIYSIKIQDESGALGVDRPIIYFTNKAEVFDPGTKKNQMIRTIFDEFKKEANQGEHPHAFFSKDEIGFAYTDTPDKYFYSQSFDFFQWDNPNRLGFRVDLPVDGYLVRLENFDKGWKATVDGIPQRIYRANYAFQAIKLPAGRHRVVFEFDSMYPFLLAVFMCVSVLIWLFLNYYLYTYKLGSYESDDKAGNLA